MNSIRDILTLGIMTISEQVPIGNTCGTDWLVQPVPEVTMKNKVKRYKVEFLWTVPECAVNGDIGTEAFRRELQDWVNRTLIQSLEYCSDYKVREVRVKD